MCEGNVAEAQRSPAKPGPQGVPLLVIDGIVALFHLPILRHT